MKKVFRFLRSMKFGMLLLTVIAALSIAGTLIPQDQEAAAYEAAYPVMGKVILFLGLDHLYSTWYYIGLFGLLGLSLLLCSVLRFGRIRHAKEALLAGADRADDLEGFSASDPEAILKKNGFRRSSNGWMKNALGLYGSFVTHLAMLLMLIACACIFSLQERTDYSVMVGDTVTLEDGTAVHVDDFSMEDADSGELEYRSTLSAVLPDETVVSGEVRVNHPKYFGRYKVYQQSYAYAGQVDIRTEEHGQDERATLDGAAFLTLDGVNGISYMGSYGTFIVTADGQILPEGYPGAEGEKADGYMVAIMENGGQQVVLAKPDETLNVAGVYYTFRAPMAYPGLRFKTIPSFALPFLYLSFALLVIGLYLCFFHAPAAAVVRGEHIAIKEARDSEMLIRTLQETAGSSSGR